MSEALLRVEDVWKWRGGRPVLCGVSFEAHAGECVAIGGENGAGKSTLLAIVAGLLAPDRGIVTIRSASALCPQQPALYDQLTPSEHFALFGAALGLDGATSIARGTALMRGFDFARDADRAAQALSGGTRQKLNLCLALLGEPRLLFLDEPYGGFDVESHRRYDAWRAEARAAGDCIVAVTHLSLDRGAYDRRYELHQGVLHASEA